MKPNLIRKHIAQLEKTEAELMTAARKEANLESRMEILRKYDTAKAERHALTMELPRHEAVDRFRDRKVWLREVMAGLAKQATEMQLKAQRESHG